MYQSYSVLWCSWSSVVFLFSQAVGGGHHSANGGVRGAEYEVLRLEGLDDDASSSASPTPPPPLLSAAESDDELRVDSEISFNPRALSAGGRKRARKTKRRLSAALAAEAETLGTTTNADSSSPSPTKMKRLRLILGKETVSTVNYSD